MADRTGDHLRLGDAEREQASALLCDHYAEGRIDTDEYSDRLDAIWAARTRADLRPVFADLPAPAMLRGWSTPEDRRQGAPYAAPHRPRITWWVGAILLFALAVTVLTHLPFFLVGLLVLWIVLHRRGPRRACAPRHHYGWR